MYRENARPKETPKPTPPDLDAYEEELARGAARNRRLTEAGHFLWTAGPIFLFVLLYAVLMIRAVMRKQECEARGGVYIHYECVKGERIPLR